MTQTEHHMPVCWPRMLNAFLSVLPSLSTRNTSSVFSSLTNSDTGRYRGNPPGEYNKNKKLKLHSEVNRNELALNKHLLVTVDGIGSCSFKCFTILKAPDRHVRRIQSDPTLTACCERKYQSSNCTAVAVAMELAYRFDFAV